MKKLIMPLLAGVSLLSGCAGMNSDFDCNTVAHDRCITMEQANQQAAGRTSSSSVMSGVDGDAGKTDAAAETLPGLAPVPVSPSPLTGIQAATRDAGSRSVRAATGSLLLPASRQIHPGMGGSVVPSRRSAVPPVLPVPSAQRYADTGVSQPVRVNPTTARLWIAGWIDRDDVLHQPSVVSFVVKPDHWAGS
ncbi:type IV conjugative transfer system lipoprotein TraV [Raoultella ornithinolytica]|uniref:type IV conjugative transfer system lipoprotein TraV n=1 Tax=Raoultella ornithinolytica TaxID=54291 RepID=UPI00255ABDF6|nr:type IV conjugative transfer system lipoprotein TraV [Raoultella ornithinolytica]MDL4585353.1 type IV conjugative transfer system lipoprotein TraV [Raoultella ornithinolytica]MDV1095651.1 type IV conjugative transfer system lipoprotein TraV [Raoultella ornithinolytica]MDV1123202.1 type IV conjugative transfer system lipoprotein TraV [Raoultella ornithinolytica]MDV1893562.1 type IV conjugative transfer system lipoprotein TraV [Raoultella ornithinolytica]HEC2564917.1 type IV conjugative trans